MVGDLLEVGAKVRVLRGPFAGKVGVISELDGKGGARVTLGLMTARILLHDLESSAPGGLQRARPAMSTSHRHPEHDAVTDVRTGGSRSKKTRSRLPSK